MDSNHPIDLVENRLALLNTAIDEKLKNEVRTTIPGHVLEFDQETQLAKLQIGIQLLNIDGKTFTPPPIIRCPVQVYGGTGGVVEVEIKKGDECLIHFSMRCIDGWRTQGGVAPLLKIERFRETDAFAVVGFRSLPKVITQYSNEGIKLRSLDGTRYVWLRNDGSIEFVNPNCSIIMDDDGTITASNGSGTFTLQSGGDIDANGATITTGGNVITAAGTDLDAFKAEYDGHQHTGNQGSPTSPPI